MFVKKQHLLQSALCLYQFAPLIWAKDGNVGVDDLKSHFLVDYKQIPGLEKMDNKQGVIPQMYAGHISTMFPDLKQNKDDDIIPSDFGYFFWKFQEQSLRRVDDNNEDERPLILWFNGGPGCSSMDGALVESGPFRIDDKGNAVINPGSWHTRGDLVFIDQPIGTGFSSFSQPEKKYYENDLNEISLRLIEFLGKYFEIFPEDLQKDIILAGESYAGQYIPYFASAIHEYNRNVTSSKDENIQTYNLKSLLIGNGWIDPATQSLSYLPFAMENGLIDRNSPTFNELLKQHESCQNKINSVEGNNAESSTFEFPECSKIIEKLIAITSETNENEQKSCINVYNYDLKDAFPACGMNWPQDISNVEKFFTQESVQKALHIDKKWENKWKECRSDVDKNLLNKGMKQSVHLLPDLLQDGIEIILFNGDKDLICNNKGILDTIDNLNWGGSKGFTDETEDYQWIYRNHETGIDENAGFIKYDKNLTFISVFNASHMVPHDKGDVSRGIVDISLNNVLFDKIDEKYSLISGDLPFIRQEDAVNDDEEEDEEKENNEKEKQKEKEGDESDTDDSDEEDDDDKDEDKDNDSDDEDDDEDDDEEEEDDDDEEKEEAVRFNGGLVVVLLCFVGVLYGGIKYRKIIISRLFGSTYEKITGQKKTVTWADDLENGDSFDIEESSEQNTDNDDIPPPIELHGEENLFELDDMEDRHQ